MKNLSNKYNFQKSNLKFHQQLLGDCVPWQKNSTNFVIIVHFVTCISYNEIKALNLLNVHLFTYLVPYGVGRCLRDRGKLVKNSLAVVHQLLLHSKLDVIMKIC